MQTVHQTDTAHGGEVTGLLLPSTLADKVYSTRRDTMHKYFAKQHIILLYVYSYVLGSNFQHIYRPFTLNDWINYLLQTATFSNILKSFKNEIMKVVNILPSLLMLGQEGLFFHMTTDHIFMVGIYMKLCSRVTVVTFCSTPKLAVKSSK